MINKDAIKEFLDEKLGDWDWCKKLTEKEVYDEIKEILPKFKFKTKPYQHQLAAFIAGYYAKRFLFFLDMGTGKTKITLDVLTARNMKRRFKKKILVLVPFSGAVMSWEKEIQIHSDFTATPLLGSSKEKWEALENSSEKIVIVSYDGLKAMLSQSVKKTKGRKQTSHRVLDGDLIARFASNFEVVVYDEIHRAKNPKSLVYRTCLAVSENCKLRYGLTGTPFGRNLEDLWSQFYLIDDGETLGRFISLYREAFFISKWNFWGGMDFIFEKKKEPLLQKRLKNRSIRYSEEEANKLPRRVAVPVYLDMTAEMKKFYKKEVNTLIEAEGNYQETQNSFIKMRQIASGFINIKTDEDKVITEVFKENPKLEALLDLITDLPETEKVVVFYEFNRSGDVIEERLKKLKIKTARLWGKTKDKGAEIKKFQEDKKCQVFIVNHKSGSMNLNLQCARYVVFFESPVSPIDRKQCEKRCHRTGQTRTTFLYDLLLKDSVDLRIQEFIKEGKDLFKAIMTDKKKLQEIFNE